MSNTEFEVLFDACDRTDEVQFRALFTPLAQTNLTELILSPVGYGDDFHLIKKERISTVLTSHSQGRPLRLPPEAYRSYDFAEAKQNFLSKNEAHFKAVYFDLAPLLSIPSYQEAPVQSLHKIVSPDASFSRRECEALINAAPLSLVAPTESRTPVILKSAFVNGRDGRDQIRTDAFSYDIEKRVDIVPVYGDDGRWHNVPVPWDEYIPLTRQNHFFVAKKAEAEGEIVATRYELALLQ